MTCLSFFMETRMSAQSNYDWSAEGPTQKKFSVQH